MRAYHRTRRFLFVLAPLLLVLMCSVAVHPSGRIKQSQRDGAYANNLTLPPEVKALFIRSCQDCHSSQTVWPWYSYVAPVSWLIEKDVRRGRDRINLSYWSQYSLNQQEKLLADIATVVKNHEMPLPQYALMHRNAKLSDGETDMLYQWARRERRKLKTLNASAEKSKTRGNISGAYPVLLDESRSRGPSRDFKKEK